MYGAIPQRSMRGHTVTLLDNISWVFGGCDDKDMALDINCFDIGAHFSIIFSPYSHFRGRNNAVFPSHPETVGDASPPSRALSRAHTAILVDENLVVYSTTRCTSLTSRPAAAGRVASQNIG